MSTQARVVERINFVPPTPAYTLACWSVYISIHIYTDTSIMCITRDQEAPFSKIGTDAAAVHVAATCFKVPVGMSLVHYISGILEPGIHTPQHHRIQTITKSLLRPDLELKHAIIPGEN